MVDTARNPKIQTFSYSILCAGFPTAGGFPGYLRKGIRNITEYITSDRENCLFYIP